tara:strand:+ start:760 stop:888 length:129 start_codon:yes stop_codon:yes gene_type:complete
MKIQDVIRRMDGLEKRLNDQDKKLKALEPKAEKQPKKEKRKD